MGYATMIMQLRDVDRETEVVLEALDGDSDDGAVIELRVTQPYGSSQQTRGYVRLTRRHFDSLAEWIGNHANNLRNVQWAEENAPREDEGGDDE